MNNVKIGSNIIQLGCEKRKYVHFKEKMIFFVCKYLQNKSFCRIIVYFNL